MKIQIQNSFITDNSNECENGCFFLQTSANSAFAGAAAEKGAKIISIEKAKEMLGVDENIKIVGITGTNGKTTTAAAIYSTLLDLGYKCALTGTRGAFINDKRIDEKGLTTSSVIKTLSYLYEATKQKCEFLVMEVSSHAIAQNRIEGLKFALKIFTNLTQDHLDYHKTFEEYARVKSSFFADESVKLINKDDKFINFNLKNAF
ncbi:MAG: UDP-N-acetylmuramoyl-L-alanyl-D-glutamate--2,6-diaminopimelate ligase, partial [Campylobacter sp.]|nr:UDP-N-acetylmuramoyl-L-alanyl-D-glutamate--2,6-diaminopimelate ligase [Campylobacter sp.]